MKQIKKMLPGLAASAGIAVIATQLNRVLPGDIVGAAVIALLIGMMLNPWAERRMTQGPYALDAGLSLTSKRVLKLGIMLMGISLSYSQIFLVGRYALIVMGFTFLTAFGVGNILGRLMGVNWKLTNLLAVSTAICGGTAVAAVGPTIEAEDSDIAYAISATFIFDILTVILFPWFGKLIGLDDLTFGMWAGTAVNDTSSVVAAGYAFSDAAGAYAVIVKLTRTLGIVLAVLVFSLVNQKVRLRQAAAAAGTVSGENTAGAGEGASAASLPNLAAIFPWFILGFLAMVGVNSAGLLSPAVTSGITAVSKFCMVMALAAIGLRTDIRDVKQSGIKPMILGVTIDSLVVVVSLAVIVLLV